MQKYFPGFTLAELMVVITLIAIISIGISRINFNNFTNNQRVLILSQKIVSRIDTIKNYAKSGYGVGAGLITPDFWRISFSSTGVSTEYTLDNKVNWNNFPSLSYELQSSESILELRCNNPLAAIPEDRVNFVSIELSSTGTSILGCNAPNFTELGINIQYGNERRSIYFSTLNGVIETKKD